ncbi:MAG TPA: two-component regulator propeller domain-containing protein [Opitutaceae bacterium]|nr:two-component regulator propeller domain-containing protein [Opitutaceae bacterium]
MCFRVALLGGCLLAVIASAFGAESSWVLRTWQSDDGLPNNNVTDIAETTDGFLWIATPAQLARFDGVQFENFWPKRIVPQFDRKITALLAGRDGALWLGMDHGPLLHLHDGAVQVVTPAMEDLNAAAIVQAGDGAEWIDYRGGRPGIVGGILLRVQGGKAVTVPSSAGGGDSRSLARDGRGQIWLARDGELSRFRTDHFADVVRLPARYSRLAAASNGGLWVCSGSQLLHYDDRDGLRPVAVLPISATAQPTVLLEDRHGALWIGTSIAGLFRYAAGRVESVPTSHPEILCLREDREGNLWAGTGGGGLDRLQPRSIVLQGAESGLPLVDLRSLCEDAGGDLWAATENGTLLRQTAGRWRAMAAGTDWPGGVASAVAADASGAVWIGTQDRRLYRWQNGKFQAWEKKDGLVSRVTCSLLIDRAGDLWVAGIAPESLQCLRAGQLETFPLPPDVRVTRAMAQDADGTIWVGTSKGALLRVQGTRVTDEAPALTGADRSIRCLCPTPDGSLWIGYAGWGLGRLKHGHWSRLTSAQGLADDQISEIVSDHGWLWIGADHGIFKVRQREFEDVVAGRAARLHPIRYGSSDGLPSLQANFGNTPGALHSRDGMIWLPMRTGVAVVNPRQVRQELAPPVVWLKRVVVDDRVVAAYGGAAPLAGLVDLRRPHSALRLPPDHRRLEFDFTVLSLAAPENVNFQYRLDGLDDHWIENAANRTVSYSRLPAGDYTFRVQASNRDGVWSQQAAALAFTVEPFFWETWWFRLGAITVFSAAIIALARYISFRRLRRKLRALERQAALDQERARIAKDIHDDVGGSLTHVTLLSRLAQRDCAEPDKVRGHVGEIAAATRSVTDALDEIVWAINPRNDTLPDLINYLAKYAREFLRAADLKCELNLPSSPPAKVLSAEVRHNLFLGVKEALNNAVRHARAARVALTIACSAAALTIEVTDDGRGFDGAPHDDGADGLRNIRQRLAAIGGEGRIESRAGGGTCVRLILPWPAEPALPAAPGPLCRHQLPDR